MFDGLPVTAAVRHELRAAAAFVAVNIFLWAFLLFQLPDQQPPPPLRSPDDPPAKFDRCAFVPPFTLFGKAVSEPGLYLVMSVVDESIGRKALLIAGSGFLTFNYPSILAARESEAGPCRVASLSPAILLVVSSLQCALAGGLFSRLIRFLQRRQA